MSVVLPDPEAPIKATISPRVYRQRHAAQHGDFDLTQVIGLADVFQPDQLHVTVCSSLHGRRRPGAFGWLGKEWILGATLLARTPCPHHPGADLRLRSVDPPSRRCR